MEGTTVNAEELIEGLQFLLTKRQLCIDCSNIETYNKRVAEKLNLLEKLIKTQVRHTKQTVIPAVVLLAKLWPQLTPELKRLLVIAAKISPQESSAVELHNLCTWLLENLSPEIPLFIEVLQEIKRQEFPAVSIESAQRTLSPSISKVNTVSVVRTFGETTSAAELHRFHFGHHDKPSAGFDRIESLLKECPSVPSKIPNSKSQTYV